MLESVKSWRGFLLGATFVGFSFCTVLPASAISLTQETALTTIQQNANNPCIFSTVHCTQPAGFPTTTDLPGSGTFSGFSVSTYNVGNLRTLLNSNFFDVAIDTSYNNDNGHTLNRFYMEQVGG